MSKDCYNQTMKKELEYKGNNFLGVATNIHLFFGTYTFLVDFMALEDISEFVEDELTSVILGSPFKSISGLEDDVNKGKVWLKNGNDKTIFIMPRTMSNFKHLTKRQLSFIRPLLEISNEDKANGYEHLHQKIKNFYNGCLKLGNEYKKDEKLLEWIQRGDCHIHKMTNGHR